jgi:ribosome recycling factor
MGALESTRTETEQKMQRSIDALKKELQRIRTGRATPALLDGIFVDYYGTSMEINKVANISVPDPRQLVIQPWEKSMITPIEKAILVSNLGLNPKSDGNLIRLPLPPLSEERRKDLVKNCKKTAEDNKVVVRNIRREGNDRLKDAEKKKEITEDQLKKGTDEIQKLTDKYIKLIDDTLANKEKEIMEL